MNQTLSLLHNHLFHHYEVAQEKFHHNFCGLALKCLKFQETFRTGSYQEVAETFCMRWKRMKFVKLKKQ